MQWTVTKEEGIYILRYYLPCEPIYRSDVTRNRMNDLIAYCTTYDIGAVMLFVDLNPYWYYAPDDVEHTKYYVPVVKELSEKLREQGISYQLNIMNLVGSWDGGADLQDVNGWENYVDEMGKESMGTACSMGTKFRQIAGEKLRLWAETLPDAIWLDDDLRFHNHRTAIRDLWSGTIPSNRADFGCFCDNHIARFNQQHNTSYSREEIRQGILTGTELRSKWLAFSGECATDFAQWIEGVIHEVSPDIRVAIMTSYPDDHSLEGRNWEGFLTGLSGEGAIPLLRPTFGPYTESNPRDFTTSYAVVEQLKETIRYQYKGAMDFCPELECTRFTRWSKSLAAVGYQVMLSAFLGCKGLTLSIFDLEGCVLSEQPEFGQLLKEKKPFIDTLAKWDLWDWKSKGIGLFTMPDRVAAPQNCRTVSQMAHLCLGRLWDSTLLKAGIPCRYVNAENLDDCAGMALDAFTARQLTDAEVKKVLSKGVLLDAGAAEVLEQRGFGQYLGISVKERVACIAATEVLHSCTHVDGSAVREPLRIDGLQWNQLELCGAEEMSAFVTPYGTEHPGFTRFRNELGGVVYVFAGNGNVGDGFYANFRMRFLKDICKDISADTVCAVNNRSYALLCEKNNGREHAAFIANLAADAVEEFVLETPYAVEKALVLDGQGREHPVRIEGNRIRCSDVKVSLYEALVCRWVDAKKQDDAESL